MLATRDLIGVSLSAILMGFAIVSWLRASSRGESPSAPAELRGLLCLTLLLGLTDLGASMVAPQARQLFVARFGDLGIPTAVVALAIATLHSEHKDASRRGILVVMSCLLLLQGGLALTDPDHSSGLAHGGVGLAYTLFCIAVLLSPRVKRFCSTSAAGEEVRPC